MTFTSIDHYISLQDEDVKPVLKKIRETIHLAAPMVKEKISYQMPTFYDKENLIHFAVFKDHIGIFPGGEYTSLFQDKLIGYKTSKGTIHFPKKEPLDYSLIREIVMWRISHKRHK